MSIDEAMKRLVAAVEAIPEDVEGWMPDALTDALIDAKKAIAEADKEKPVAWKTDDIELYVREDKFGFYNIPLYTRPQPKREWVGLTDDERDYIVRNSLNVALSIEEKLKEKNT